MATTVFPGFNAVIAVIVLIAVVELVSNNLMEPWLYGNSTGISAMAVIFAAVFWGWIWGPVGLLLATPLTVCLVVLGKHVEAFSVFTTLLGDEEPLPAATRFYQRLLANDYEQARVIAKQTLEAAGRVSYLDTVFVPALRKIRSDRESGRLSREDEATLMSLLRLIADELRTEIVEQGLASKPGSLQRPIIFAIPSHHTFEEMALREIASELRACCGSLQIASTRTIPSAIEKQLVSAQPEIVILCVLPPGGLLQAEYLCNRIHSVSPDTKVLVTFFGRSKHFDRLLIRFRKAGAGYVATSVEQTMQYVSSWLEGDQAREMARTQPC